MTTKNTAGLDTATPKRRQVLSDGVSQSRQSISTLAFHWQATTWAQRDLWEALGRAIALKYGTAVLTGYQAFVSVNSVTLAQSGSSGITLDAPATVAAPLPLPNPLDVSALQTSGSGATFHLHILSAVYGSPVELHAAPPVPAGHDFFDHSSFKRLGQVSGLDEDATDITGLYAAVYGSPGVGAKIALKLTPINPAGFKGNTLFVSQVVQAAAQQEASPAPTETPAAATGKALHLG